jgi:hypothetical protein
MTDRGAAFTIARLTNDRRGAASTIAGLANDKRGATFTRRISNAVNTERKLHDTK